MGDHPEYKTFLYDSIPWKMISGLFLYFILVLVYYLIVYYHNLKEKMMNEAKLMGILKETELNLLKSQINPHFLFNSLNSISSLTISDAEKAQEMIIKLSDFLRYTISMDSETFTTLNKEIDNIKRYLEIEKIRFGDKLNFIFKLDEACQEKKIPQMILQPLYENAIKHGVYESIEPIMIQTNCRKKSGFIEFSIENNFEKGAKSRKGAGLGLKNTLERLKLIYQNDQLLRIEKSDNVFKVIITFPE